MKIEKLYDKEIEDILNYKDFLDILKTNPSEEFLKDLHAKYEYRSQEEALRTLQVELIKLQDHLEKYNEKMIILIEGRDASGKGGAIRRITRYMNEKHYRVVALGRPSDVEKNQWYFQRYIQHFPKGGEIVLFDRSWYNRSMVEPVFGFCTEDQYETFMKTVPRFEEDLIDHGIHFLKIYFSVSKEEQSKRFEEREENPLKHWKLSEIDLQMQERWDEFTRKKYRMLKETNTKKSPWTIIRSDDKFIARVNAIKTILNKVDYEGRDSRIDFKVDPKIVISAEKELEIMAQTAKTREGSN
ncbi:polyphosphate kinase 2 [Halarcobacter sp.]|uniref:polyphosphate kinase 2 n=1 Tax=Halarcobacter sp. TaxID=2321133 RepID=UPI0029F5BD0B|nr:polyphosphate kinase 2 [Halarcobacter sp.]